MGTVIRIDDEVFEVLKTKATPLVDAPNDVLRRVLGLKTVEKGADARVQAEKEGHQKGEQPSTDVCLQIGTTTYPLNLNSGAGTGKLIVVRSDVTLEVFADFEDALSERFSKYLAEVFRSKRHGRKEARYKAVNTLIDIIFDTYLKNNNY